MDKRPRPYNGQNDKIIQWTKGQDHAMVKTARMLIRKRTNIVLQSTTQTENDR